MYYKIYAIPGWGFDKKAFLPLELDVEVIDWRYLLKRDSIRFSNSIFIGWSLGGYLAIDKVKGDGNLFLLAASGDCFSYKSDKKYGVDSKLITKLKEDLNINSNTALNSFYSTVFSPNAIDSNYLPKPDLFTKDELNEGLDYLNDVNLDSEKLKDKDIRVFIGKKDSVIDRRMGLFLKRNHPGLKEKIEIIENAGHFIGDYKDEILKVIDEL